MCTVPVPNWVKATVDAWLAAGGIEDGFIFRCVTRAGTVWVQALVRRSCGGWCVNMPRSPQSKSSPLMTFAAPVHGFATRPGVSLNRFNSSSVIDL